MTTVQQEEALHYFRTHAEDWRKKAEAPSEKTVNMIRQRNGYVIDVILNREKTENVLDIGCGTGDLVCEIAGQGIDATGVDFAREMIDAAIEKAKENKIKTARFECCSIFDFDFSTQRYDVISANGFIEYISYDELNRFLDLVKNALKPNGSFVVGSRNRLFNLFSINTYTSHELETDSFKMLAQEAIALASTENIRDLLNIVCVPLQSPDTKHEKTGIDVTTRFQFTPVQLMKMLNEKNFTPVEIYPIHIHAVPPVFKDKHPEIHASISNLLQEYARNKLELIPFSSSFMLHVQKEG